MTELIYFLCCVSSRLRASNKHTKEFQMKLRFFVAGIALVFGSLAHAERVSLNPYVTHAYEFDPNENPTQKYWCGHTALKMVTRWINKDKPVPTLSDIHSVFLTNSPGQYAMNRCPGGGINGNGWCASLYDILTAAKKNYNMPSAANVTVPKVTATGAPNHAGFLAKIQDAILNRNSPIVTFANWDLGKPGNMGTTNPIGHAYVIVGYNTDGATNPGDAYVFVRDSSQAYQSGPEMDDWWKVRDFMIMMERYSQSTYFELVVFR
ncbi:MAG: C39 family peptidase [Patescibacteria group bacterium]